LSVLTVKAFHRPDGYQWAIVPMTQRNEYGVMQSEWLAMEQYRLDCVEAWDEGRRKQATRAAILSSIASLTRSGQGGQEMPQSQRTSGLGRADDSSRQ